MRLFFLALLMTTATHAAEPLVIPLWPEGVPDAQPNGGAEYIKEERVYNVQVPTLTYFPAPKEIANGAVAVVCPGGGYVRLSITNEGSGFQRWLNSLGVSVFVLKYRLKEYGHPAPLRDVLRAVRIVRSRASEFGVDPHRVGVFGSSAGGHLAACAGTLFDHPMGKTGAVLDAVSARPDFILMQYPVILMEGPFVHQDSRTSLLGNNPSPELSALLSVDRQVTRNTPPAFLVATAEDKSVPLENAVAFYTALRKAGVSAELHLYEKGPHGFGLRKDLGPTSDWPKRAEEWMHSHGWLKANLADRPRD